MAGYGAAGAGGGGAARQVLVLVLVPSRRARAPRRRLLLPGLKQAMIGEQFRDGKKVMDWQISDVQYFDKLDERLFAKPE